jgi:alpha-L-rhamnosidase
MPSAPTDLRFDHQPAPVLGTGAPAPRLSWIVPEAGTGYVQASYEVEVARDGGPAETFRVESAEQVLVPWPAAPLVSRQRATVRVRVAGGAEWSPWSEPAYVEAGLLAPDDWTARFVGARGGVDAPAPVLRGRLTVPGEVARARLYVTAHGLYRAELNGVRVGDQELAPGWTSYPHRLRYQAYDVTGLVRGGDNVVEALLGNGWYRGRFGWRRDSSYGDRLALLAQLEVTTTDGRTHVLGTDASWTATASGVLANDLYDGQRTDLREPPRAEEPVEVLDEDLGRLVAADGPPVRVTEVLPAVAVTTSPSDRTLVDFGQNLVGWVRLRVRGAEPGHEVVVRHAEVLEGGELGTRPLRSARATDSYLLASGDEVLLEPWLTFHGFRYAEVTGVPELRAEDVEAVVVGSDLRRTGWFGSSYELLDRFHDNVVWSARGNFLEVPTDCPQRDERLGWTGDLQVFCPTGSFLFDSAGFLDSWLADLALDQLPDGSVPFVVPDVLRDPAPAAAAWGDAAVVVPWTQYERTGDRGLLARQFASMRAWVDREAALAGPDHLWTGGFQFGDWLDPAAPPENPFAARTDPDVVATAYLARSADLVARTAEVLDDAGAARHYGDLAAAVRNAFAAEYVTAGGRVLGDSPTAYAMALAWDLVPDGGARRRAGRRLADLVRAAGFRIGTGFVGTPLIADALTAAGELDVAYRLLLQTGCPSWLYPVTMGATTIWERWDSMLPDGRINPGQMTSFNHYALGAVADWLHRTVAGLAPAAPGYRELLVAPRPPRALTAASARHRTPYGEAAVAWRRADGRFTLRVTVPVGATATVYVPGAGPETVGPGTHDREVADPCAAPEPPRTVRDVLDDEPLWSRVVAAVPDRDEVAVAARLSRYLDVPAAGLVDVLAGHGFPTADELRQRLGPLLPSPQTA